MANKKITDLNVATDLAATDVLPVVDVSADETKKITATNLFRTLPDGTAAAPSLSFASDAANGVFLAGTDTVGITTGGTQRFTVDGSGNVAISGDLTVSGATTTVESTTVTIDDKNLELGSVATPTDSTADGGGITLKGATDKEIKWINSTGYWTFNTGIDVTGEVQCDSLDVDGGFDIDGGQFVFDATNNRLNLADNVELRLGAGADLQLYHNGTNSHLVNNTGGLFIDQYLDDGDISIRTDDGSGGLTKYILCDGGEGAVKLYHYGSTKLATKSDGVDITGELQVSSGATDVVADFASSDANAWIQIRDNSTTDTAVMIGAVGNDLRFRAGSNEAARITSAGRLGIGTSAPGVTLDIESTSPTIRLTDSDASGTPECQISGAGGDLILEADRDNEKSDSLIKFLVDGSEHLRIDSSGRLLAGGTNTYHANADDLVVQGTGQVGITIASTSTGKSNLFFADSTSNPGTYACYFEYDHSADSLKIGQGNSERIRLDSSGRLLLGTTTEGAANADNLTVADSGHAGITIRSGTSSKGAVFFSDATSGSGEYQGVVEYDHSNNSMVLFTAGTERLRINTNGAWGIEGASNYGTSGQVLTSNGNDAPTWQDAGAAVVGGASAISMNDNVKIKFGAGDDLQIYHNGANSFIDNATGDLYIRGVGDDLFLRATDDIYIQPQGSENGISVLGNGAVELYYNNSKKFETKSDGVDITGELQCDSLDVDGYANFNGSDVDFNGANYQAFWDYSQSSFRFQDNAQAKFGTGEDLQISHDGSNSFIYNYTADLFIGNAANDKDIILQSDNGSGGTTQYIRCDGSAGAVRLYNYGSEKLTTFSSGVDITGELQCDSLDVDGASSFAGVATFNSNYTSFNNNGYIRGDSSGVFQLQAGGNNIFRFMSADNATTYAEITSGGFRPGATNTYDLGTSSLRWRNVYTNDLNLSNEGSTNDVDGTWGNYTIQEGEDDLFLINRRNGKKYKFNLTEVS